MTKVFPCSCSHKFQDEEYGKGRRLHNEMIKNEKGRKETATITGYRCTVCGNKRGV